MVFISTDQLYDNPLGYSKESQKLKIQNYYSFTKYLSENYIKKMLINIGLLDAHFLVGEQIIKNLFQILFIQI